MAGFPEFTKKKVSVSAFVLEEDYVAERRRGSQAADQGRRQGAILPPIEAESTFNRVPRKGANNLFQTPGEEDGHGDKKFRKVSVEVDRKIVNHLRKKLNKRVEKHLKGIYEAEFKDEESSETPTPNDRKQTRKPSRSDPRDLYRKYSDVGEKISDRKSSRRKVSQDPGNILSPREGSPTKQVNISATPTISSSTVDSGIIEQREAGNTSSDRPLSRLTPLPDIEKSKTDEENSKTPDDQEANKTDKLLLVDDSNAGVSTDAPSSDDPAAILKEGTDPELFKLTKVSVPNDADDDSDGSEDIPEVSPVPTPLLVRPLTREQTRLTFDDRLQRICRGQVHVHPPNNYKTIQIYVSSGFSDTEVERTVMIEKVYPRLKAFCLEQGHELQILDLHWGMRDTTSDDHMIPDLCLRTLDKALNSHYGLSVVLLLGQKYGPCILPTRIPMDEFDAILRASISERFALYNIAAKRVEEAEKDRADRKRDRQVDGTPTNGPGDDDDEEEDTFEEETSVVDGQAELLAQKQHAALARRESRVQMALTKMDGDSVDPGLLQQWYKLDENCVPPVYKLQPISSCFKEYQRPDASKRQQAKNNWMLTAQKLQQMFQKLVRKAIRNSHARRKYFISLLELEVDKGIMDTDFPEEHVLCFVRTFEELQVGDEKIKDYFDMNVLRSHLDPDLTLKMEEIRDGSLPEKIPPEHLHLTKVTWSKDGIQKTGRREHTVYLEKLCQDINDIIQRRLEDAITLETKKHDKRMPLLEEIAQHVGACHEKTHSFQGRKEVLHQIKTYLRSKCQTPLVIHGNTGSGKSAILAKAAKDAHRWMKGLDLRVIVRMIGSSSDSMNIRVLLRGLCLQLCEIFDCNVKDIPSDYKGLINDFSYKLSQASERKPIAIFIDSLDQLTDENEGRKLAWLPHDLPKFVYLVVATLPDEKYGCLTKLKTMLDDNEKSFINIPELPKDDAAAILKHWLNRLNRSLTQEQYEKVIETFAKCPTPLFLKVAFNETMTWTSYMDTEHVKLGENVKKIATIYFGRLEKDHSEPLVRRALGYITACRKGITSNEMEDVLSLDEVVMNEVTAHYQPPIRRIPTILWARLKDDLGDYLMECKADNVVTLRWSHSDFTEAATERYLTQRDKAPSYHKALAEYFSGKWSLKPKPHTGTDAGSLRYVAAQPLFTEPEDTQGDGSDRVYNLRKLNELPFHYLHSQQMDQLKTEILCNFEWMLAKLMGTSIRALLEEYQAALSTEPGDIDLKLISDSIQLSAKALVMEPRQLASQILGRLYTVITKDIPTTAADPKKYPYLHPLFAQAQKSSLAALIPSIACLAEPGDILFDLLSGHTEPITAVTLTTDGMRALTTSKDNSMKLWDLRSGRVTRTLEGVGINVHMIRTGMNNSLAITSESTCVRVWSLRSGECMLVMDEYDDPATITTAADGHLLVALYYGCNTMRVWDLEHQLALIREFQLEDSSVHKDRSILVAGNSHGDQVLHAFRSSNFATSQSARTGKVVHTLKCFEKSSSIVTLAISRDYFILVCRQQYMKLHEIHQLELFDTRKGNYLRSIRGCVNDNLVDMFVNQMGSHALAVSVSEQSNTSDIAVWNLETEDHKHLARHAQVSTQGACIDFRYCLTAGKSDNTLRIWNLSNRINQPAQKLKKTIGIEKILPMIDNPRYVVAKAFNNGPISVWNVAKAKCLQSAVRIERGLVDSSDVVLVRNSKVVILSERGFSNISDDSKPVFQTVFVYDLRSKRYENKVTGCFIVPSQAHEYMLLENSQLLGLSENRGHFIIWNLKTGKVLHRIKTNFKEMERRKLEQGYHGNKEPVRKRGSTAKMTPWDLRSETKAAREERHESELENERQRLEELKKEKENVVQQYIMSADEKVIVASFYAHHLCVFNIRTLSHIATIESEHSMMFLYVSALTPDGSHLAQANYDEETKTSYVTLWDCVTGLTKKRLKNEVNVCALGITEDADRVVIGKENNELRIWDPMRTNSMKKIKGYPGLNFGVGSKIFIVEDNTRAVVFAGDISLWDIEKGIVLSVFNPDMKIQCCNVAMGGKLIVFGLFDRTDVVILKLMSKEILAITDDGEDLFGEKTGDTSDEEEEDEEENAESNSTKSED